MKYLFIVQGEGRGHMTQALALSQVLRDQGHTLCHAIVGKSKQRALPEFFREKIKAPILHLDSPNFVTDKHQKSVKPFRTIVYSLLNAPKYQKSIVKIHEVVEAEKPDVIINFYDFLGGLYNFLKRPKSTFICLAHQFLIAHPAFDFPPGRQPDKLSLILGNKIASLGAHKILALSFQELEDLPKKKLFVVPPLLRDEIRSLPITQQDHFLVYMVNPGYSPEVEAFHRSFPDQPLHCFWDKKGVPDAWKVDDTLTYHQLDDQRFLRKMASARAYVTTAGFESVCEAMYLGKPVLMVPVEGHYEQACNAVDAVKAGAGIASTHFEIEKLQQYLPHHQDVSARFQGWADQAPDYFSRHLPHG